jgi:acetoin utilization protein AcuB
MLVRDCMTRNVITVNPGTPSYDALSLMKERHIRRLPVLRGNQLVGIVTWTDLMRASPSFGTRVTHEGGNRHDWHGGDGRHDPRSAHRR